MAQFNSALRGERSLSDELVAVGRRLLAIADNPAVQWSEAARIAARNAAHEMLSQAWREKTKP
jgi:hypothetical protein